MQYDKSLIEVSYITINGQKVRYEKIPKGMNGPNGAIPGPSEREESEDLKDIFVNDAKVYKEYSEYFDEGKEPDLDEIKAIKEEIENEMAEETLGIIDLDDEEEVEE